MENIEILRAIANERLRCVEILHQQFMAATNVEVLDALETAQKQILDKDFNPSPTQV